MILLANPESGEKYCENKAFLPLNGDCFPTFMLHRGVYLYKQGVRQQYQDADEPDYRVHYKLLKPNKHRDSLVILSALNFLQHNRYRDRTSKTKNPWIYDEKI